MNFLAEVTQHIPDKGEHLVRYYGWYSHRQRGIREKGRKAGQAESGNLSIDRSPVEAQHSLTDDANPGDGSTWAMLIKRVYEVDLWAWRWLSKHQLFGEWPPRPSCT